MSRPSLTEFDREVLSVLLSSGGWNASARSRLAVLAKRYGVSSAGLSRVVAGLAQAARGGRLQQAIAEQALRAGAGGGARVRPAGPRMAGAVGATEASAVPSAPDAVQRPSLTRTDSILLGIVSGLLLVSAALAVSLGVMLWRFAGSRGGTTPGPGPSGAATAPAQHSGGAAAPNAEATENASSPSAAPGFAAPARGAAPGGEPSADGGANERPPTVPVSYPRVPGFSATLASLELDQALAQARGAAFALESIANDAPNDPAAIRAWTEAQRAIGRSWPRLDAVTRRTLLDRSMALLRRLDDASAAELLIAPLRADLAAPPDSPGAVWRGAWSAGVLGSLLSEPGLAPEVVSVIAGLRLAPAEGGGDAFDRFAAARLDEQLEPLAERVLAGAPQEDFDRFEAWIEAMQQVRPANQATAAWLRAIETLLHRPLRFDLPGTAADLMGRFASMAEWRAGTPGAAASLRRMTRWLRDSAIPSPRLWALGSMMRQGRFAPWFDASMIVGERATLPDRERALARIEAALGPVGTDVPLLSRIPQEFFERWNAVATAALTSDDAQRPVAPGVTIGSLRNDPAASPSGMALAGADELLRLSELLAAGTLLLADRSGEAAQRLSEIESRAMKPSLAGLGPGGRSLPIPAEPSGDGLLARRLDEARTPQERIEVVRRRRAEAALDLGPLDAARLVREAYHGEPSALRLTAQGVIVDSFASGRRVAQELVDQFVLTGGADSALARFVERLTGERLPPHPNPAFRPKAMAALLRHRLRLSEHPWHAVDALLERMAAMESVRLEAEGGAADLFRDSGDPGESLVALGDLLRARAAARIVTQPFPAALDVLDRRDEARRALADGGGQRLVAALWRALELEAYLAAAERPSLVPAIRDLLAQAQERSSGATSAIEQAVAVQRGRVALLGARLAAASSGGAP